MGPDLDRVPAYENAGLAVLAAGVILLLITTSVFAPFLANAAPIYYVGVNRFEYQEAGRTLRATLTQLIEAQSSDHPDKDTRRLNSAHFPCNWGSTGGRALRRQSRRTATVGFCRFSRPRQIDRQIKTQSTN